jgi:hypothetical protein
MDRSRDADHENLESPAAIQALPALPPHSGIDPELDFDRNIACIRLRASTVAGAIINGVSVPAHGNRLIQPSKAQAG